MTPSQEVLARRAVACPGWRWSPGMRYMWWSRSSGSWHFGRVTEASGPPTTPPDADALPDLDDPATLGCILARVREAWGFHTPLYCEPNDKPGGARWWVVSSPDDEVDYGHGHSEAEALVIALETAPKGTP